MARQIVMEFDYGADRQRDVSRVLNFNESLYNLARDDRWMSFPIGEIDKTTGQRVAVKSARQLRRVSAKIHRLLDDHGLASIARLTVVIPQN
jgi:hypothetical protein